jgi:ubiquinone/menaquinone biosynthesis C-methylase UbiE
MSRDSKSLVQKQFGDHAEAFVTSKVHAHGESLQRLLELVNPKPTWSVLDIATGGGHTALAFSGRVRLVVAADITWPMLQAARKFVRSQAADNIQLLQTDSERLGIGSGTFDCVTCRIAAHHFSSVETFVEESRRILMPGGVLAITDNIVGGGARTADYVNKFDKLRDPSHQWAYSLDDWQALLSAADFSILHLEMFHKHIDFNDWAMRMGVGGDELNRLQAMLTQAPQAAREWLQPRQASGRLVFSIAEAIAICQKA